VFADRTLDGLTIVALAYLAVFVTFVVVWVLR
jgi:hypothetical protein